MTHVFLDYTIAQNGDSQKIMQYNAQLCSLPDDILCDTFTRFNILNIFVTQLPVIAPESKSYTFFFLILSWTWEDTCYVLFFKLYT